MDYILIKYKWKPLILYIFSVSIFLCGVLLSGYFYKQEQYAKQFIILFTHLKVVLMIVYAEGIEVQIGQRINYRKYPNILFVFDMLTNLPAISMMAFP